MEFIWGVSVNNARCFSTVGEDLVPPVSKSANQQTGTASRSPTVNQFRAFCYPDDPKFELVKELSQK